jgi:hypothetical protein
MNTNTIAPTNIYQMNQMAARGERQLKTIVGVLLAVVMIGIILLRLYRAQNSIFNRGFWRAAEQTIFVAALAGFIAIFII